MNIQDLRNARARGERPVAVGADFRGADFRKEDFQGANFRDSDFRDATLWGANLQHADFRGANLLEADFWGADLRGVKGGILQVTGLHPHHQAIMVPTTDGWLLRIGCWQGTTQGLRDLIAKDDGWPSARGEQITQRRPLLASLADMCDAHAAAHTAELYAVIAKWGTKENAS